MWEFLKKAAGWAAVAVVVVVLPVAGAAAGAVAVGGSVATAIGFCMGCFGSAAVGYQANNWFNNNQSEVNAISVVNADLRRRLTEAEARGARLDELQGLANTRGGTITALTASSTAERTQRENAEQRRAALEVELVELRRQNELLQVQLALQAHYDNDQISESSDDTNDDNQLSESSDSTSDNNSILSDHSYEEHVNISRPHP